MRVYEDELDDATMMEEMHREGRGAGEEMYLEDESGKVGRNIVTLRILIFSYKYCEEKKALYIIVANVLM